MGYKTLTFHAIAFAHHAYTIKYVSSDIDYSKTTDQRVKEMEDFGPRYITTWNLFIQTIYLFLALTLDLSKLLPESKRQTQFQASLAKYKGYLYTVILFPTTLFVALTFWTLFWINRDWVLPENIDEVAPKWINHSIHSIIVLVIFLETILTKRALPRPAFKTAVIVFTAFGFVYFTQFLVTYFQFGRWLYGIFYDLTWPQRVTFILVTHIMSVGFLKIGFYIQSLKTEKLKNN